MNKFKILLLIFFLFSFPKIIEAADRYWVGGGSSTNWNATGNTNWAATSGGAGNASVPTTGDRVFIDSNCGGGTVNMNTNSASLGAFNMSGSVCTLAGSSNITVQGVTASTQSVNFSGTVTWTGLLTMSPTTATANINFTTNGTLFTTITKGGNASASVSLQDNLTFTDVKTNTLTLNSAGFNLNGFTVSGNSNTSRLLIQSNTLGTQIGMTRSSGGFANVDFKDIDLESSYNCSAITGGCGDAGGNSADFTFTSSQTNYWVGGTGNWSDSNEWANSSGGSAGSGRVPLPQDSVVFDNGSFDGTSQTVTLDMPRIGKNIDWGAYNEGQNPTWSKIVSSTFYGSMTLNNGISLLGGSGMTAQGRGSFTWTNNGLSWTNNFIVQMIGGTLTMQDAFSTTGSLSITNGTFDANDFNITATSVAITANTARTVNMGSGTWTVTTTGGVWDATTITNLTFNPETSTILISNTTATSKIFTGGGLTYNNLTISGRNITITGNNTFNVLALNNGGLADGLIIGTGSTQTISSLTTTASLGNVALLSGVVGGGTETLSDASGNNCVDYLTIASLTVTGGASWYAGANSSDSGGNSGWTFSACPASNPNIGTHSEANEKVRGGVRVRGGVKFR